jgi:hypothetical protein
MSTLKELDAKATQGEWRPDYYQAHDEDGGPSSMERDGICVDEPTGPYQFMTGRKADEDFVIALVNAYRAGRLIEITT